MDDVSNFKFHRKSTLDAFEYVNRNFKYTKKSKIDAHEYLKSNWIGGQKFKHCVDLISDYNIEK